MGAWLQPLVLDLPLDLRSERKGLFFADEVTARQRFCRISPLKTDALLSQTGRRRN